jgi:hypothetical protein
MLYFDNENIDEPLLVLKKKVLTGFYKCSLVPTLWEEKKLNNFGAYNINTPKPHSLSVTDRFLSGAFSFVTYEAFTRRQTLRQSKVRLLPSKLAKHSSSFLSRNVFLDVTPIQNVSALQTWKSCKSY